MKLLKIFFKVFLVIFVSMLTIFGIGMIYMTWGQKDVLETDVNEIDLPTMDDGNYVGTFEGYRWTNSVSVTVVDHKITEIKFVKPLKFRSEEIENKLFSRVIEKQSTLVDVVSGATISSKAMLKSIENALNK